MPTGKKNTAAIMQESREEGGATQDTAGAWSLNKACGTFQVPEE